MRSLSYVSIMENKFSLRNKRAQDLLDELTDGRFSRELQKATPVATDYAVMFLAIENVGSIQVYVERGAIYRHQTYDPDRWNLYPNITPPTDVWMMCETMNNSIERKIRHIAKFDGKKWWSTDNKEVIVHQYKAWI